MLKIKNTGCPVYIGKTLCGRDTTTQVPASIADDFFKTVAGAYRLDKDLFVISDEPTLQPLAVDQVVEVSFVFDPEKHHIEHRGAGKWFVMEGDKKIYGPLTTEEREAYEYVIGHTS